jgi:signal transduction histidine kinase
LLTRAGKRREIEWQLAFVPSAGDQDVVLFAIGHDITDRKALIDRTLRNEKLAAVGTLAAGLAHEIRNPLNGALLHVTFLERSLKKLPEEAANEALGAVRIVGEEIRRLSALVKDFLVFARPSPANLKSTQLNELCRRTADVVRTEAGGVGVTIDLDLQRDDVAMQLDPEKIEQVLLNLLRNAVEAVATVGDGTVVLRTRRRPRDVTIEIEDDGPGLPSPDAPIFDAFFSTKPNGTGLGLAIVQRIVTDHGGSVMVDSKPGRTVFRLTLPVTNQEPSGVAT